MPGGKVSPIQGSVQECCLAGNPQAGHTCLLPDTAVPTCFLAWKVPGWVCFTRLCLDFFLREARIFVVSTNDSPPLFPLPALWPALLPVRFPMQMQHC